MSEDLIQKVITAQGMSIATGGGALKRQDADRFIDYMLDVAVLLPRVRTERMTADVMELDKIGIGRRVLRGATEAVDDGINVGVAFSKISLTSSKFRADWELSRESLEDGIEGDDLEDRIARMMTRQIGQDMEDLAINGDKSSSDPLLHHLDGFALRGREEGNVVAANAGEGIGRNLLSRMIKAMPRKYMARRQNLQFFAGSDLVQNWSDTLGSVAAERLADPRPLQGEQGFQGQVGYSMPGHGGIRLNDLPLLEDTDAGAEIWLTDPQNLVWGIRRNIEVFSEFATKKDTIEYTVFTRVAANVEEKKAFVVATGVDAEKVEPYVPTT